MGNPIIITMETNPNYPPYKPAVFCNLGFPTSETKRKEISRHHLSRTGQSTRNPRGKLSGCHSALRTELWKNLYLTLTCGFSQNPKISLRACVVRLVIDRHYSFGSTWKKARRLYECAIFGGSSWPRKNLFITYLAKRRVLVGLGDRTRLLFGHSGRSLSNEHS